ncbi:hypothetical protein [Paenibacillus yonginensis]|uniref:hypothetical protein n=1 Tax=Paenibacillus yonginensis TaxID=1462996 RepID=UPI001470FCC0
MQWKYSLLLLLIGQRPKETLKELEPDIRSLAYHPSTSEQEEGDELAKETLTGLLC